MSSASASLRSAASAVMARVRQGEEPARRRPLAWMAVPASLLICGAIGAALLSRAPVSVTLSLPAAPPLVAEHDVIAEPLPVITATTEGATRRISSTPRASRRPRVALSAEPIPITVLEAEPIAVAAIDMPRLEPEAPTSIEALKIDELTIEPLAASND